MATDPVLLNHLAKLGIDREYVEFTQDYAPRRLGKEHSPYAKFYRDLKSDKRFMVVSGLPMVDADGVKIEVGWRVAGINYFSEKNNLFRAKVQGTQVEIIIRNDQPDGRKANDRLSYKPQLFLNGVEQIGGQPVLLPVDPLNPNYLGNTLEWDYGICKRRLRIIEGSLFGSWVFPSKPAGEVRIKYNQTGNYGLRLGQFKVSDDEEVIKPEDFDALAQFLGQGYPVTISDTSTYYPDADPETSSVDGMVTNQGTVWATVHDATIGSNADPSGLFFYIIARFVSPNYRIDRGFTLFDVTGLPGGAVISAATISVYGQGKTAGTGRSYNIYSSNPATNASLITDDYEQVGATAFCDTARTQAAWTYGTPGTPNNFALNASGIAAISGVSKFSIREVDKDVGNAAPTDNIYVVAWAAEQGAGYKPRLVVTYTIPGEGSTMPWKNEIALPFTPTGKIFFSPIIGNEVYIIDQGANFYKYNLQAMTYTQLTSPLYSSTVASRPRFFRTLAISPDGTKLACCSEGVWGSHGTPAYNTGGGRRVEIYNIATNSWVASKQTDFLFSLVTPVTRSIVWEDNDTLWVWCIRWYRTASGWEIRCVKYVISTDTWTAYSGSFQDSATGYNGVNCGWSAAIRDDPKVIYGGSTGIIYYEYTKYDVATDTYLQIALSPLTDGFCHTYDRDKIWYYEAGGTCQQGYIAVSDDSEHDDRFIENTDRDAGYGYYVGIADNVRGIIALARASAPELMSTGYRRNLVAGLNPPLAKSMLSP